MENKTGSYVLVVGATGFLGMEICQQLVAAKRKVKALVRSSSDVTKVRALQQMGVETVIGDIKDAASLQLVFTNVSSVISSASSTLSRQEGDSIETVDHSGQLNVVAAAEKAGATQFIFISFPPMSEEFPLQTAKRAVEKQLTEGKMNYTILQPSIFMEVWLSPVLGFDYPNAKARIFGEGKNKLAWISLRDVAAFAVACLDNPAVMNSVLPLGGPDSLSALEVVNIFEQHTGTNFTLEVIPVEALHAQKNGANDSLSQSFAALMLSLTEESFIDMKPALNACPIILTSVKEYAQKVSAR